MPDTEPVIRRAGGPDAEEMAEVWIRSFARALPDVRRRHDDTEVKAWFAHVVVPDRESRVAVAEGRIAGLLVMNRAELEQLYLDPPWRGRGLGDRLVGLAKRLRPAGLELWTFQVNGPARRFYERHGFTAVEWTDGTRNEEQEPDVRYVWRPPSGTDPATGRPDLTITSGVGRDPHGPAIQPGDTDDFSAGTRSAGT